MNIDICYFDGVHLLGESATHPIELLATCLGVLLPLEGRNVVAPTQTRRQQPTRARSTEDSRIMLSVVTRASPTKEFRIIKSCISYMI